MGRIADVLGSKGHTVHTTGPSSTVFEAIEKMVSLNVGCLVVMDEAGEVRGIVTERDYLRKIALLGRSSRTTEVHEIMTSPVRCIGSDTTVEEAMAIMTEMRHRHLPIVNGGRLAGLASLGDLAKYLVRDQKFQIEQLTNYIGGTYPG